MLFSATGTGQLTCSAATSNSCNTAARASTSELEIAPILPRKSGANIYWLTHVTSICDEWKKNMLDVLGKVYQYILNKQYFRRLLDFSFEVHILNLPVHSSIHPFLARMPGMFVALQMCLHSALAAPPSLSLASPEASLHQSSSLGFPGVF